MMNSKPEIYLIYEGLTEEIFFKKISTIFTKKYNTIYKNAHGKDKIIKEYLKIKKLNPFANVLVMYDLDNEDNLILDLYKGKGIEIKNSNIYYINPSFESLLILIKSKKIVKKELYKYIEKTFHINNYKKTESQLNKIINSLTKEEIIKILNDKNCQIITNYDNLLKKLFIIK